MSKDIEIVKCPCCGASMKKHWHRLSAGLAVVLIEFRNAVIARNINKIHVPKEIALDKTQYNNFQKLRYFGLIAKYKDASGKHEGGYWLLTRRGNQFCKGLIQIPIKVQTFRNKISGRCPDTSSIFTILKLAEDGTQAYWDTKHDFAYELADIIDIKDDESLKYMKDDESPQTDGKGNILLFK
jgi:hypothetical protein